MGIKKGTAFGGSNRNEVNEVPTFNRSASADRDGQSRASRPPKGDFRGVISEVLTEHEKSRSVDLLFRARDGTRTRTDIAVHRILSPACLPIPPLEHPHRECKSMLFFSKNQKINYLCS